MQGSSVLVMKTHNLKVQFVEGHVFSRERLPYGAAVLLVRDPRAALVAEWNREKSKRQVSHNVSNHFTYVGQEYFGEIMLKLYNNYNYSHKVWFFETIDFLYSFECFFKYSEGYVIVYRSIVCVYSLFLTVIIIELIYRALTYT